MSSPTFVQNFQRLPENIRGALWIVFSGILLTMMGLVVKQLGRDLHSFQVVFFRCLISTILMLPFIIRSGLSSLRARRPWLLALRVCMGMAAMSCVFYAFSYMPFGEAVAIIFSRPLFTVLLAILLLGEALDWHRASAATIGFLGVLVIIKPGTAAFDPVSLAAVAAAGLGACIAVTVKKLSRTESTATIVIWFAVAGAVISFVPALLVWRTPTLEQWGLLFLVGVLGVAGQITLTRAFSTGETSFVTPFDYLRLVFAILFGFLLFGEIPDFWAFVGALVIVGSGYYIARRELARV